MTIFYVINTAFYKCFVLYISIFCEFYFKFHKNDYFIEYNLLFLIFR